MPDADSPVEAGVRRATAVAVALVAGVFAPAIAEAAFSVTNPVQEQLVEGHTVFAALETAKFDNETRLSFAAAVAVLVREQDVERTASRFPGVLWFNDQFLVSPAIERAAKQPVRYPCTGAVLAVNLGDPAPPLNDPTAFNAVTYTNESYLITDPNDHVWSVDRWRVNGSLVWTVPILGSDAGASQFHQEGRSCAPFSDEDCGTPGHQYDRFSCTRGDEGGPAFALDPGEHGMEYPCTGCASVKYNALLYMLLEDLFVAGGPKNHTEGSSDSLADASACQSPTGPQFPDKWPCPGGNDDREGNSHPYNPETVAPFHRYDGYRNHGGSEDCSGDGVGDDADCHATRRVDLYFGVAAVPLLRHYRVQDIEGSAAPYHCHEGTVCALPDVPP